MQVKAHSIIIATGATAKRLGIPSEEKFWSNGISACAICDGTTLPAVLSVTKQISVIMQRQFTLLLKINLQSTCIHTYMHTFTLNNLQITLDHTIGASYSFRNKELAVVGGGDTAVEEAIYLTKYASKVKLWCSAHTAAQFVVDFVRLLLHGCILLHT